MRIRSKGQPQCRNLAPHRRVCPDMTTENHISRPSTGSDPDMITQMLYTSLSRHPRGHSSDYDILQEAMRNNRSGGVTGYLLRDTDRFCQVLEGPQRVLESLYNRIHLDPRHYQIVLRMQREVRERSFLGWSMGYGSLSAEDSAVLERSFAGPPKAVLLAFGRGGRIAGVSG